MNPSMYMRLDKHLVTVVTAFQNTQDLPPFQKLARRIVAHLAPETSEIVSIRKAFYKVDEDDKGKLSMSEMAEAVRSAGYAISSQDIEQSFKCVYEHAYSSNLTMPTCEQ